MKCGKYCYPCCNYCIYIMKELGKNDTAKVSCGKYPNSRYHLSMVLNDGYCKDFICENTKIKNKE